ncbi:hypothetical protein ACTXT7_006024 [Hymenolepis weldensis]
MEMNWPPPGKESSIFKALLTYSLTHSLTHSEHPSSSEECMAGHRIMDENCGKPMPHPAKDPQGLRVNADADADAYVETPQFIIAKPPWIDSVANGGRPLPLCLSTRSGPIP